jgi:transcriptional regulator with XRE-family HTH domain
MNAATSTRRRSTDVLREAARLSQAVALSLGEAVMSGRVGLGLTQARLAERVGVHQTAISRVESGRGRHVPLELWIAIGLAIGRPLAISLSRPLAETRDPADAGHLAMQEYLIRRARETGRNATFELPTRPSDPTRSIDVCVRDARNRVLIIEEAWNTFTDLGAAIRATNRKTAEAADLAATVDDGPPYRVATVWVVRATATNRALLRRYPQIIRTAFPGSSRSWVRALTSDAPPPISLGLVWFDSATGRLSASRLTA